jgi:hypothetical protein
MLTKTVGGHGKPGAARVREGKAKVILCFTFVSFWIQRNTNEYSNQRANEERAKPFQGYKQADNQS